MIKKEVKVAYDTDGYDRVRLGKQEHVKKYTKEIDIPELSKETEKRIKHGKAKRITPEKNKLNELAKQEFGVTDNCYRAGYILEDGSMLDFGDEKNKAENERKWDHETIWALYGEHTGLKPEKIFKNSYRNNHIYDFMKNTNAIRLSCKKGTPLGAEILKGNNITKKQWETLEYCSCIAEPPSFILDIAECKKDSISFKTLETHNEKDQIKLVKDIKLKLNKSKNKSEIK
jgi:hypothetical protein